MADEKKDRWKTARVEAAAAQGKPRVEVRKRPGGHREPHAPLRGVPGRHLQGVVEKPLYRNPDPAARGISQDVCLVLPGALQPFDAPFYIQAEWERQPLLLTQHCYSSYFILKTYVAMLPGTFF